MKGPNLQIAEFKQEISDLVNKSTLPFGVKQMALNEVLGAIINANAMSINAERKALEAEEGVKEDGKEIRTA